MDDKLIRTIQTLAPPYIIGIDYSCKQQHGHRAPDRQFIKGKEGDLKVLACVQSWRVKFKTMYVGIKRFSIKQSF